MSTALPFRSRVRNVAPATAAPVVFVLIATMAATPDSCRTILRGEVVGSFASARQHAIDVLAALVAKLGAGVDVQLLDAGGVPLFIGSANAGGAL